MRRRGNELRIIAGRWRGRRIGFPDAEGLRPTGDRLRETLFNWLQPSLPGARCLDLFAGSGALGIEAASRGAKEVVLVERARAVADQLKRSVASFDAHQIRVIHADAGQYLAGPAQPFDVVFLDPPFGSDIIGTCCDALERGGWLADDALIYIERDSARPAPTLPPSWSPHRDGRAGQVAYTLLRRRSADSLEPVSISDNSL